MAKYNVAVLGDSVMWGQGLKHADKFAVIAAQQIAKHLGKETGIPTFTARSGAQIAAAENKDEAEDKRGEFVDTFPAFFANDTEEQAFIEGDERNAGKLFGEIPSTFPTVRDQVQHAVNGENIELVIINGGANDIGFQNVLNPEKAPIESFESSFKVVFLDRMKGLLEKARKKFPNAVIIVTGYYSAFSGNSDEDKVESFARHESGKPWGLLLVNDILIEATFGALHDVWEFRDTDIVADEIIKRSEFGHTRVLHWLRRAVAELNETNVRGSGIIFVPSGFRPENALFASGTSYIHEDYEIPVHDAAVALRESKCPRFNQLAKLKEAYLKGAAAIAAPVFPIQDYLKILRDLLDELDGPASLRLAIDKTLMDGSNRDLIEESLKLILREIARIERARRASFFHPNEAGASQYAKMIVDRFKRHQRPGLKADLSKLAKNPKQISVKDSLKRYGLDPKVGVGAQMQHMMVDSIALRITSSVTGYPSVYINGNLSFTTGGNFWRLRNPFAKFRPETSDFFTFDTFGALHLEDITELTLINQAPRQLGPKTAFDSVWRPTSLILQINGKDVFETKIDAAIVGPTGRLTLPYPG